MSRYYKNKNFKKNQFKNSKFYKTGSKILVVLLMLGVVGAMVSLLDFSWFKNDKNETPVEYKTVYLVPGDEWDVDSSNYLAYVWTDGSNQFVNPKYNEENNAWEFTFDAKYKSIIFVDLKEETNSIGLNWSNVREQSPDCVVPEDDNVYYHVSENIWSNSAEPLYTVTTEVISVRLGSSEEWVYSTISCYVFDKRGINEPLFLITQYDGSYYYFVIPVGYTHLIFIDYEDKEDGSTDHVGTWEGILHQTKDLIIPSEDNLVYSVDDDTWTPKDDGSQD